jgi:hypothetical protein
MFHLRLRQFPHNHCQFNLTEADASSFAELWVRGDWMTVGGRHWNPRQARVTLIEAPRLEGAQLSMGRGWRQVERTGKDATQRLLAAAAPLGSSETPPGERNRPHEGALAGHTAGVRASGEPSLEPGALIALLGEGPRARQLIEAWRRIAARFPDRSPSESLAQAERELDSAQTKRRR